MSAPKASGRKIKKIDIWGWAMSILGLVLMGYYSGFFTKTAPQWWLLLTVFLVFAEYAIRVSVGRIYKFVYYDTIIYPMYELKVQDRRFFVNAENEEELALYMGLNYAGLEYEIVEKTHTETFVRTDSFV